MTTFLKLVGELSGLDEKTTECIQEMVDHTDCYPWYWLSCGEKDYSFATVAAYPCKEDDKVPTPGSQLIAHEERTDIWIGENGTEMLIDQYISTIEEQNGDTICKFIAMAYNLLMEEFFH